MPNPKKKINVTGCTPGYNGNDKNGNPYTIFDITGADENGVAIPLKLKSFSELPIGPGEYEVETYTNAKSGESSYTLKDPNRRGGGGGVTLEQFNALSARVAAIEATGVAGSDITPAVPSVPKDDMDDIPF